MQPSLLTALLLVAVVLLGGSGGGSAAGPPVSAPIPTWESLGLTSANVRTIAVDPDRPSIIYAGGESAPDNTDFFRSFDGGLSWQHSHVNSPMTSMFSLTVDTSQRPHVLWASGSDGVFTSNDDGETWSKHPVGGGYQLAFDPTRPGTIYFAGGVNAAARSTDGAVTAQKLNAATVPLCDYGAVAVAPSQPSTVYLGGGCGVFRSTDRGATWQSLPGAPVGAVSIVVDPRDPAHLYVAIATSLPRFCLCTSYPLWESRDGGQTWSGIADGDGAGALLLDPRDPDVLYLSTGAPFMRWSRDGGATWHDLGGPLPAIPLGINALAVDNGYLLAGGRGGVWRLALPAPHDARYFAQTGYRIDNDAIWNYFQRRGGVPTFGYPTSRTFLFKGFTVQFFQRRVVRLDQNGNAHLLDLLDPDLLNDTQFNGSTFPSIDRGLVANTLNPLDQRAVLAWVQQHAPDTFAGQPVNFDATFNSTVSAQIAFPDGMDPGTFGARLSGIELELWGLPTSQPLVDPNNHHFIYLRWQHGLMMYDAACICTQGVLQKCATSFRAVRLFRHGDK